VNLDESEDEAPTSSKAPKGKQSVSEDEEDDEEDSEDEDDDEEEFAGFGDEDDQMSQGESDDEEDDDDDAAEISDPELPSDLSDEESNGDLDELDAFVDQIASEDKKRKTQLGGEEEADTSSKKKRRVLPVVPGPAVSDGSGLGLRSGESLLGNIMFIQLILIHRPKSRHCLIDRLASITRFGFGTAAICHERQDSDLCPETRHTLRPPADHRARSIEPGSRVR
jgi:hypothetical protein